MISTSGDYIDTSTFEGRLNLSLPFDKALSSKIAGGFFDVQVRDMEDENSVAFKIERGGLGASSVEF